MMRSILILFVAVGVLNAKFIRDDIKEVVLDTKTNLIWQDDGNAKTNSLNWSEAITYCEDLSLGGYSDWHLPNFNELYYLANREKFNPAMDSGFNNVSTSSYWTSTTYAYDSSNAWVVFFYYGYDYYYGKSNSHLVRCVRDGQ